MSTNNIAELKRDPRASYFLHLTPVLSNLGKKKKDKAK